MTSAVTARMKRGLFTLLTASLVFTGLFFTSLFFPGGWIKTASAERLTIAENLVSELLTELEDIEAKSTTLSKEARKERLTSIMDTYFDVEGITRFTAGRYWRAASKEQRQTYSELFRGVLLSEASNRFEQILNFSFTPTNAQARGDKLILVTGIARDQSGQIPDTEIIWRLSAQKGKPIQIIDLEIENISMLKTQQDENTALIKRNGGDFSALIDAMRVRLESVNSQTTN